VERWLKGLSSGRLEVGQLGGLHSRHSLQTRPDKEATDKTRKRQQRGNTKTEGNTQHSVKLCKLCCNLSNRKLTNVATGQIDKQDNNGKEAAHCPMAVAPYQYRLVQKHQPYRPPENNEPTSDATLHASRPSRMV